MGVKLADFVKDVSTEAQLLRSCDFWRLFVSLRSHWTFCTSREKSPYILHIEVLTHNLLHQQHPSKGSESNAAFFLSRVTPEKYFNG